MTESKLERALQDRKQTDKSINDERTETNKALEENLKKSERLTDESVSLSRNTANAEKEASRALADKKIAADSTQVQSHPEQDASARKILLRERTRIDKAIDDERERADIAITLEREERDSTERVHLQVERKATDRDLALERKSVDVESQSLDDRLLLETTSHLETRKELTTRDDFLAIVSHDLRNPLGAISMSAEALLADFPFFDSNQSAKHLVDLISRNASDSLRMISDLLDVERISHGTLGLEYAKTDIIGIIEDTIEMLQSAALLKSISLVFTPSEPEITAAFDRDRIQQVLSNLIGNAIKFTPASGVITITVQSFKAEVKVSISDTGPGIPKDQVAIVFERFSQLQRKDRRGLGLGLYISKQIIESHLGKIWIESKGPSGSVFVFSLPTEQLSVSAI